MEIIMDETTGRYLNKAFRAAKYNNPKSTEENLSEAIKRSFPIKKNSKKELKRINGTTEQIIEELEKTEKKYQEQAASAAKNGQTRLCYFWLEIACNILKTKVKIIEMTKPFKKELKKEMAKASPNFFCLKVANFF